MKKALIFLFLSNTALAALDCQKDVFNGHPGRTPLASCPAVTIDQQAERVSHCTRWTQEAFNPFTRRCVKSSVRIVKSGSQARVSGCLFQEYGEVYLVTDAPRNPTDQRYGNYYYFLRLYAHLTQDDGRVISYKDEFDDRTAPGNTQSKSASFDRRSGRLTVTDQAKLKGARSAETLSTLSADCQ